MTRTHDEHSFCDCALVTQLVSRSTLYLSVCQAIAGYDRTELLIEALKPIVVCEPATAKRLPSDNAECMSHTNSAAEDVSDPAGRFGPEVKTANRSASDH